MWEETTQGSYTVYKKKFSKIEVSSLQEVSRHVKNIHDQDKTIIRHARTIIAETNSRWLSDAEIHIILENTKIEAFLKSGNGTNKLLVHIAKNESTEALWHETSWGRWIVDGVSHVWNKALDFVMKELIPVIKAEATQLAIQSFKR